MSAAVLIPADERTDLRTEAPADLPPDRQPDPRLDTSFKRLAPEGATLPPDRQSDPRLDTDPDAPSARPADRRTDAPPGRRIDARTDRPPDRPADAPADDRALRAAARELEGRPALDVLRWAAARYGRRLSLATGFGAEGCVLIDLIGRHALPIDIFTLDTGLLFDETYALWRQLEARYGIAIRRAAPAATVDEQARAHGDALWAREPDACCGLRKVTPLQAELAQVDAWITAIRRHQTPERASAQVVEPDPKFGIAKINPLVEWTKDDVWRHLKRHDVPYNPLHDQGHPSIGCRPCTSPVQAGETDRAGRWRGLIKTECGLHGPALPAPAAS